MNNSEALSLCTMLETYNKLLIEETIAAEMKNVAVIKICFKNKKTYAPTLHKMWCRWIKMCVTEPETCASIHPLLRLLIMKNLRLFHLNLRDNHNALKQFVDNGCTVELVRQSLLFVKLPPQRCAEVIELKPRKR